MMRRSAENRRRSSMLAPRRVSDSAVKSAVKPSRTSAAAAPGSSVKSRLPRPSTGTARAGAVAAAGAASAGPRTQRSVAGVPARSRLTSVAGPRLSAFTPQTARRPQGPSTASKAAPSRLSVDSQRRLSRGSGIGANRQRCPDPRPISDKSYWQPATHRVAQFLAERGYNENRPPVTYKDLMKCTGRDFDDIFTFIYGMFCPDFTMTQKKREEVVPALMKTLNYPGLITKSHLITIGCAHSWPSVVAVLDWLADEVHLALGPAGDTSDPVLLMLPTVDNNGFPELDRQTCVLLEHNLTTYSRWLRNQERENAVEAQDLMEALAALQTSDPAEMRRLEAENQRLRQEAPDLSRLEQRYEELVQRRATADLDARRLAEHVAGRREQQAERNKRQEWLQRETQERARLIQLKRDQIDALKLELSQQELSAEDVAKIAQQRSQLHKRIEGVKEEIEQLATDTGSLEMELARARSQRQATVRRLNTASAALQSTDLPAVDGLQLRLAGTEEEQLAQVAEAERALDGAERAARHQLERQQSTLLQQERNSREVRGQLEQARQEQFHVNSRLRRLEEEDAADGRQLQQRHATLDNQITEVESEISRLNQELQQLDVASQRSQLEAEIKRAKELTAEREQHLAQRSQQVAENAALALEFRRWMDDDTDQLFKQMDALHAEADEKLQKTMQRHRQQRDQQHDQQVQPQAQAQAQTQAQVQAQVQAQAGQPRGREPLAERNQEERDNRAPPPPPQKEEEGENPPEDASDEKSSGQV